jgi:hypothetical protein
MCWPSQELLPAVLLHSVIDRQIDQTGLTKKEALCNMTHRIIRPVQACTCSCADTHVVTQDLPDRDTKVVIHKACMVRVQPAPVDDIETM